MSSPLPHHKPLVADAFQLPLFPSQDVVHLHKSLASSHRRGLLRCCCPSTRIPSLLLLADEDVVCLFIVLDRYESQKRRDWNTFGQYLRNHRPPLSLARCSGAHVLEFLRYLDQFGKTKVHVQVCPFFGHPSPPAPCPCPLRQAWGSLDALVGRLRAAYEENGGRPENNPFAARAIRLYLREVRDLQSKARGVSYEKKKRKKAPPPLPDHHHPPPLPP
ncbi:hypothetical protein ZIOFF_042929 [Zingiber officinale]|uniref:ALOG domain-containing protein n=1 Tax=Zingiber officinale TaxID=94328 RepID=A0A8J5FU29_ZINOF|nr:hypothetical protein ZIOFF_042929 [Zingiber officinale]